MTTDRDGIRSDLRAWIEPDGYNAREVIRDLAEEYGVPVEEIQAIYDEMNQF